MFEQQLFLARLPDREFQYWLSSGRLVRYRSGETVVLGDDFSDLGLLLDGRLAVPAGHIAPGIIGLDSWLLGAGEPMEWVADSPVAVWQIDTGAYGRMLGLDPGRHTLVHQALLPILALRLSPAEPSDRSVPFLVSRHFARGVQRFQRLCQEAGVGPGRFLG